MSGTKNNLGVKIEMLFIIIINGTTVKKDGNDHRKYDRKYDYDGSISIEKRKQFDQSF